MKNELPETVPLTDGEKRWLLIMYNKRLMTLLRGIPISILFLTFVAFTAIGIRLQAIINDLILGGGDTWLVDQHVSSGWYIKIPVVFLLSAIIALLTYITSVRTYKLDIKSGVKWRVPYRVIKKEYFPVTQQYFVYVAGFDKHIEISKDTYEKCEEDGNIMIDKSIRSNCIFSVDDHFEIIAFS